jgi:hypothetical protein
MKIKFHKTTDRQPTDGQFVFIKTKSPPGKRIVLNNTPRQWDADSPFNHGVLEWAAVPPHAVDDPSGWLFPSRGDDLPTDNVSCLVCSDRRKEPFYAYFAQDLYKFLGVPDGDVIAYQYI